MTPHTGIEPITSATPANERGDTANERAKAQHGTANARHNDVTHSSADHARATEFDLNGPNNGEHPTIVEDEEDTIPGNDSAELLRWHHRLNHIPMRKVQTMAKWGLLPRRLEKCSIPVCTSCMFGKAIRQPWRTKPTKANKPHTPTTPGQCVSVDQLESTTPGLIAQLRGRPTIARYTVATVFVDQFSGLSYVHLQKGTGALESLSAKTTFEAYSRKHGVRILNYHADNGIFADNLFTKAVDHGISLL